MLTGDADGAKVIVIKTIGKNFLNFFGSGFGGKVPVSGVFLLEKVTDRAADDISFKTGSG